MKGVTCCYHCDTPLDDVPETMGQPRSSDSYLIRMRRREQESEESQDIRRPLYGDDDYTSSVEFNDVTVYNHHHAEHSALRVCQPCAVRNGLRYCPFCHDTFHYPRSWYGGTTPRSVLPCPDCSRERYPDTERGYGERPQYIDCDHCGDDINISDGDERIRVIAGESIWCRSCWRDRLQCENSFCAKIHHENDSTHGPSWGSYCSPECSDFNHNITGSGSIPSGRRWWKPQENEYISGCGCEMCSWIHDNIHLMLIYDVYQDEVNPVVPPDESLPSCTSCGCHHHAEIGTLVPDGSVCHYCTMSKIKECSNCQASKLIHNFHGTHRTHRGWCDSCMATLDDHWLCDAQCSRWYSTQVHSEGDCECGGINVWNYTPAYLKFLNYGDVDDTKIPYLGLELEVEAMTDGATRRSGAKLTRSIAKSWSWCMHDGSLGENGQMGFEIVTHPMTYEWFDMNWPQIKTLLHSLREHGMRSWDSGRCGMHIHISRKLMSESHQLRFLNFIYGSSNLAMTIGGRSHADSTLTRYAPFDRERRSDFLGQKVRRYTNPGTDSHYAAVNANKKATLEARWMRGTLSPSSFRKNVEFIQSVWEFTRKFGNTSANEMNYITWLRSPPESRRFSNVLRFIEHNYITRR